MVGTAMVLAIFFTTLIPFYLYISGLYNLYSNELNSRRIRDIDRAAEELEIQVGGRTSIDPPGPRLILIIKNPSHLLIRVERIWAMDVTRKAPINEAPCTEDPIDIPPGWNTTVEMLGCVQGFTGRAQFIAVTERGRLFASRPVDLANGGLPAGLYPYTLTVSVVNMVRGREYSIEIGKIDDDADTQPRSMMYKATASNENVSLSFGATEGSFMVYLYEDGVLVSRARLVSPDSNPARVTLPDYWNVVFILKRSEVTVVTLDLDISAPRVVLEGQSFQFEILATLPVTADEDVRINSDSIGGLLRLEGDYAAGTLQCTANGEIVPPGGRVVILECYLAAGELQGNRRTGSISIIVEPTGYAGEGVDSGYSYPADGDTYTIQVIRQRG